VADGIDHKPGNTGAVNNERIAARLRSGTGAGPLQRVDAAGEAGSVSCGALVRIQLALDEGKVLGGRYQAYGCPATIACASETVARVEDRSLLEAAALREETICEALELDPTQRASAAIALDALHSALGSAVGSSVGVLSPEIWPDDDGVLVGMSGGVDSAVAAMLLKNQGYRAVGVTLRFWSDPSSVDERACCSPEAVRRARRIAHSLGIPHLTVDAKDAFCEQVVQYFVDQYGQGRTPNPCVKCNARVRVGLMLEIARAIGVSKIATGHYARMCGDPPSLARGVDRLKDQSYVLAEVPPRMLSRMIFPLGAMTKEEVRALAAAAELEGHQVPESQEICFVADDDHKRFLRERLGERPGLIVDGEGRPLGHHSGTYNYTIGQRKGLGIAAPAPLHVVSLDAEKALVKVGRVEECAVGSVAVEDVVWHRAHSGEAGTVQLRSSGPAIPSYLGEDQQVIEDAGQRTVVSLVLEEPAFGVAPGQTAVMYDGDAVRFGGTIGSTACWGGGDGDP
jgi:tRNA-uridine 2-sulfurtransferase